MRVWRSVSRIVTTGELTLMLLTCSRPLTVMMTGVLDLLLARTAILVDASIVASVEVRGLRLMICVAVLGSRLGLVMIIRFCRRYRFRTCRVLIGLTFLVVV